MKFHRLGGLNSRHMFPYSPGGQNPEIDVSPELVPWEASLLGL